MVLLAFKTYARSRRAKIEKTSGLSGRLLTQLLVQMWRDMDEESRFEWKILRARKKYLKNERRIAIRRCKDLLRHQEDAETVDERLDHADRIFRYLATAPGQRLVYSHSRLHRVIVGKLREFQAEGVDSVPRWAKGLGITL